MKKLRNMCLAVTLLLSLGAVSATSASAAGFVAGNTQFAHIYGEVGYNEEVFVFGGESIGCDGADFEATMAGASESFTTSKIADTECGGRTLKWDANGCSITYRPGSEIKPGRFNGTIDIGPSNCGPMTLSGVVCEYNIYPTTDLATTFENAGSGSEAVVNVTTSGSNLVWEQTGTWCEGEQEENGLYESEWTLSATDEADEPVGLKVTEELPIGLYLSGKESEEEGKQPKLEAESYPAPISGGDDEDPAWNLFMSAEAGTCSEAQYEATASAATSQLAIEASYDECEVFGWPATVDMNSCHYVLDVVNVGPPYTGAMEVACDEEGGAIEMRMFISYQEGEGPPDCVIGISEQEGLEGVALENEGEGSDRRVGMSPDLEGVGYSVTINPTPFSFLCPGEDKETYSDGEYSGATTLSAVK